MGRIAPPSIQDIQKLIGPDTDPVWHHFETFARQAYQPDFVWYDGGKAGMYELKFQKGGKTLFSLFARANNVRLMLIFGKAEQAVFEQNRACFSTFVQTIYDTSKTYHDGKWMMFDDVNLKMVPDLEKLIYIKKKPLNAV